MKIYSKQNVWDAALERVRFVFDEFPNVIVGMSGGKDSTICLNLALKVAEEKGRLPLKVFFIDQEAEWDCVIDFMRTVMTDPRVTPLWLQCPIILFNAASHTENWLNCWDPAKEGQWLRDKEPYAYKENKYGTDRFKYIFDAFIAKEFDGVKTALLGGIRCEESPTRFVTLTSYPRYKYVTWCKRLSKKQEHYTFYPIYDWSYNDVWKAIHDNKWPYCKLYDYQYQRGVPLKDMRVSNVHHETAVKSLFILQEVEPDLWNRLTKRLGGVNTTGQLGQQSFSTVKELPYMFKDWKEYRDYLLDHLCTDLTIHKRFKDFFGDMDKKFEGMYFSEDLYRKQITSILANDYEFTKLFNYMNEPESVTFRKWKRGIINEHTFTNKYVTGQTKKPPRIKRNMGANGKSGSKRLQSE